MSPTPIGRAARPLNRQVAGRVGRAILGPAAAEDATDEQIERGLKPLMTMEAALEAAMLISDLIALLHANGVFTDDQFERIVAAAAR